jgi:tRNA-binding protein
MKTNSPLISWDDFSKLDIRVATVVKAYPNEHARKPALILELDFGPEIGILKSSAQITALYDSEDLVGMQVIAIVNFPDIQIAKTISECLVLGAVGENNNVILLQPERRIDNGLKIG